MIAGKTLVAVVAAAAEEAMEEEDDALTLEILETLGGSMVVQQELVRELVEGK